MGAPVDEPVRSQSQRQEARSHEPDVEQPPVHARIVRLQAERRQALLLPGLLFLLLGCRATQQPNQYCAQRQQVRLFCEALGIVHQIDKHHVTSRE